MWRFKRRRRTDRIEQTGAATAYPHHGGAYLSRAAAADRPSWDGPTLIPSTSPLMTHGQMHRAVGVNSHSAR
ncbi:hypothetical protein [Micromonospora globbae]|uniref:Uncharacterized protein n=1 Tax=Micromonospora globbae TaxID=1894969 RepID=A0A420EXH2_9ACTN|nr:hypothetical protein [Micromonospora globbae]RKF25456.1 hypothetical protein D7I43_20510 [Micromonospora globbae]